MAAPYKPIIPLNEIYKPGTPVFFYSTINNFIVGGFVESFRVFPDGTVKYAIGRKSLCTHEEIKLRYEDVVVPDNAAANPVAYYGGNREY